METGAEPIWLYIIITALLGFFAGWMLRGKRATAQQELPDEGLAYKLQQRDEELRAARTEIAVHTSTLDSLRNEYAILTKKMEARGDRSAAKRTGAKVRSAASKQRGTGAKKESPKPHRRNR